MGLDVNLDPAEPRWRLSRADGPLWVGDDRAEASLRVARVPRGRDFVSEVLLRPSPQRPRCSLHASFCPRPEVGQDDVVEPRLFGRVRQPQRHSLARDHPTVGSHCVGQGLLLPSFRHLFSPLRPSGTDVRIATLLCEAAVRHVVHSEIAVEFDGRLSFDLRLNDGRFSNRGVKGSTRGRPAHIGCLSARTLR